LATSGGHLAMLTAGFGLRPQRSDRTVPVYAMEKFIRTLSCTIGYIKLGTYTVRVYGP